MLKLHASKIQKTHCKRNEVFPFTEEIVNGKYHLMYSDMLILIFNGMKCLHVFSLFLFFSSWGEILSLSS